MEIPLPGLWLAILAPLASEDPAEDPTSQLEPAIRAEDVQRHVDYLAADELKGRAAQSPEAHTAAKYIAEHFRRFGLEPVKASANATPGDRKEKAEGLEPYFLPIDDGETAPNVVGMLPGKGEGFVIVSAHYDHLPPKRKGEDRIFNGADDNASGVAGVLEIAHAFAERKKRTKASILFIAFTAEERGLRGSRHFVKNPPIPLEEIRGVVNLDMISRGKENLIFCEGGEIEPMRRAADKANRKVGLDIRYDKYPQWRFQSDHAPFMRKGIPTLYFGVEDHVDYHKVSDHADKILPDLAARVSELTFLILLDIADDPAPRKIGTKRD